MASSKPKRCEGRNWTIIGYPNDSLPDDYHSLLDGLHLAYAESPLHCPESTAPEEERKPHIHFVFQFQGNKSFDQIKKISDLLHAPIPKLVDNPRSMVRYLIHADHPDRQQFEAGFNAITYHGGFFFDEEKLRSSAEFDTVVWDIVDFCLENNITEFGKLVRIIRDNDLHEWKYVITRRNTLFLSTFLKSNHFSQKECSNDERINLLNAKLNEITNGLVKIQDP